MKRASLLLLLLAFALRMIRIAGRALWYDEAFAILYASLSPARMIYGTVTPAGGSGAADVHPLLYYFLLHGWMKLVGHSPFAARFLSVLLGTLTVALLTRLVAWCFDRHTSLAVGLLAAINPFHVAYSQEARMYALLGLAAVIAAWGLLRGMGDAETGGRGDWETGRRGDAGTRGRGDAGTGRRGDAGKGFPRYAIRDTRLSVAHWSLYIFSAALTLYTHNLGALVLLALNLLVAVRRSWWRYVPTLVMADLAVLALFGPWLVAVLPGQVSFVGRGYWLTPPGAAEVIRAVMQPVLTFYEPAPMWVLAAGLFSGLLLLTLLALRVWRTRSRAGWFLLLWATPIVTLLLLSLWRPLYLERALLPSALFYLVAAGWLLTGGGLPRVIRCGLALLLVGAMAGSLVTHYTYTGFPRPPFAAVAEYLQGRVEPGDVVLHTNKLTYFPLYAYAPGLPAAFLADPPGSPQDTLAYPTQEALGLFASQTITAAVGPAERVWAVYFLREVEELGGEHPALTWLGARFTLAAQQQFADLIVTLYRKERP